MAYMSQEKKAALLPAIKAALTKYRMKATVAVRHHSTLVVNITEGPLDMIGNYNATLAMQPHGDLSDRVHYPTDHMDVNPYHYGRQFSGAPLAFVTELLKAMNVGNHNRSDYTTDDFDVGWYVDVNVGRYDKPYRLTSKKPRLMPTAAQAATFRGTLRHSAIFQPGLEEA